MAKYKLLLPKMGESVAEATVIKWTKSPGDYIEADETVMEIATDKVDSDVPSPVAGKLLERLYKDNDVVQVGAVIAIIETNEPESIAEPTVAAPVYKPVEQMPPVPPPVVEPVEEIKPPAYEIREPIFEAQKPQPIAETRPPEIKAPEEPKPPVFAEQQPPPVPYTEQLNEKIIPKTGDELKTSQRFYSPLVKNIAAQEGIGNSELDRIPGTGAEGRLTKDDLLNYIQNKPAEPVAVQNNISPAPESPASAISEPPPLANREPAEPVQATAPVKDEPIFEPIRPEPVTEAPPQPKPSFEMPKAQEAVYERPESAMPPPRQEPVRQEPVTGTSASGMDEIIEMDRMRRLIADHMVMSKHTSPHVTSFVEADVTNLVLWRDKIKNAFEKREGEKITFTPIFIEAVVRAIKDMPMINIQVNGTQIIKKKDINISMATALPSGNLIVPVIKRADELSLIGLTKAVNDLAGRARNNKLKPDDIQGGTFTITNVGTFGNVMGTPIINQPQVAILAVGAIRKKPAVIETLQGDMIGIRQMMFLSLSYDHRVVDGALGGSFVRRVADYLENWDVGREI